MIFILTGYFLSALSAALCLRYRKQRKDGRNERGE
jgi:hypothetical protein